MQLFAPVPAGVSGLVLTHDGRLLIGAADEHVVFFDVATLVAGQGDPLVGYISDGGNAGSVYVNVTPDDRTLFVSDETQNTITVIDLAKARSTRFSSSAIIGKIPSGRTLFRSSTSPNCRRLPASELPQFVRCPRETPRISGRRTA